MASVVIEKDNYNHLGESLGKARLKPPEIAKISTEIPRAPSRGKRAPFIKHAAEIIKVFCLFGNLTGIKLRFLLILQMAVK